MIDQRQGRGLFLFVCGFEAGDYLISNCNDYYSLFVIYMKSTLIINMKIIFYLLSYLSLNSIVEFLVTYAERSEATDALNDSVKDFFESSDTSYS